MRFFKAGSAQRHTRSIAMNENNSRRGEAVDNASRISNLNLVDLAGSENACMTDSGERVKEGKYINQSLPTLSLVIQRLSDKSTSLNKQHIPYGDSKIKRFLESSLSGNSKIIMLCTVTNIKKSFDETLRTLRFAVKT